MPERRGAVGVAALAVGAAVTDEVRHALHDLFGRRRVLPGRGKADDAAHVFVTPFYVDLRRRFYAHPRRPEGWPPYNLPLVLFVGEGFIPPGMFAAAAGRRGRRPYSLR